MPQVTVRYWAGAQAAAGVATEQLEIGGRSELGTVGDLIEVATTRHPGLRAVFALSAVVVDGRRLDPADSVPEGAHVEVLPPFAGG